MISRALAAVVSAGLVAGGIAAAPTAWTAAMTATAETPATNSKGTGTATFSLKGNKLEYKLTAKGLTGPATAAHIHVGAAGVAGPPVYTFTMATNNGSGTVAEGVIDLTSNTLIGVPGDSLKSMLLHSDLYVNVHTAANPKGEIRGQMKGN